VKLPGVSSAAGVELDVSALHLGLSVPGKYKLEATLPYRVKDSEGKAKFDKAKSTLEVTLPTVAPPPPVAPPMAATRASGVEEVSSRDAEGGAAVQEQAAASRSNNTGTEAVQAQETAAVTSSSNKSEEGAASQMTENQRKWAELHAAQEAAKAEAAAAAAAAQEASRAQTASSSPDLAERAPFQSSETFAGARPGYAFKLGPQGLGYYLDTKPDLKTSVPPNVSRPSAATTALAALAAAGIKGPEGMTEALAATSQQPAAVKLQPRLTKALADDLD